MLLAVLLALGGAVSPAAAGVPVTHATVHFDIAAADLATVLQAFGRQASIQILFPYDLARRLRSVGLRGDLPPDAALRRLLARHPLRIATMQNDRIVLAAAAVTPRPPVRLAFRLRPPAPSPAAAPANTGSDETIIVTGRGSGERRDLASYSYAVTALDLANGRSGTAPLAQLFRQVPGFWVEASGGEGSNNVRARGIPTDGYTAVALTENGLPIQYDGGLGYLNTDQSYRRDRTLARVEIVRGGPASIFTPNAPGGVANFLTRSPLADPGGSLAGVLGDLGYRRLDSAYGVRITPELGILAGGFYRRDDGRRPPGYRADEGGQVRLGLEYKAGGTRLIADLRRLDDRVTFYLPVPFQRDAAGRIEAIPGFDPRHASLSGPELINLHLPAATGLDDIDLTRGTSTRLTAATLRLEQDLGPVTYTAGLRWRTSDTQRNALFPVGTPQTGSAWIAAIRPAIARAWPGYERVELRYAADGQPFPSDANGNGLVIGANLMAVHVPLDEVLSDQRLNTRFEAGGSHDLTFGLTLARYAYRFERSTSTVLIDIRHQARLLDAVVVDGAGRLLGGYTDHGVQRYASQADNARMTVHAAALYVSDEWDLSPRLRVDYGLRWERNRIAGSVAGKTLVDLGNPQTLADDQLTRLTASSTDLSRSFAALGWSAGASWRIAASSGAFVRLTRTFRLPSASEFNLNPLRSDQATVPIRLAELGAKFRSNHGEIAATAFYTRFDRVPFTDYRFDPVSNGYQERTAIAGSETIGLELEANWHPSTRFGLSLAATWQDPRYRRFAFTEVIDGVPVARDYSGRQLIRVPRLAVRATPELHLDGGRLSLQVPVSLFSQRFADVANLQRLPPYALMDASLSWQVSKRIQWVLEVTNVLDGIGLTEGNPRSGLFGTGSDASTFFLARPEFQRSVRLTLAVTL